MQKPARCNKCKNESIYLLYTMPDESTHETEIGYSRRKAYCCANCLSKWIVDETNKVFEVKPVGEAPKWITKRWLKKGIN